MKSEPDKIKNIFSSKLSGFEPELPPSLWEKIDAGLSAQQVTQTPLSRKNAIYRYIAWSAGAAAVILAMLMIYPKVADNNNQIASAISEQPVLMPLAEKIEQRTTGDSQTEIPEKSNAASIFSLGQPSHNILLASRGSNIRAITSPEPLASQLLHDFGDESQTDEVDKLITTATPQVVETDAASKDTYIAEEAKQPEKAKTDDFDKEMAEKIAAFESEGRKSAELLAYNGPTTDESKYGSSSPSPSRGFEVGLSGGSSGISKSTEVQNQLRHTSLYEYANSDNAVVSAAQNQKIRLEHNQPISFGVTVNKKISNRVSLETGIIYTYLSSKAKSVAGSDYKSRDSQYFHYLGVPLSVNFKLVEWKKLQVYLTGGGVVQKDIYGRLSTSQSIGELEDTEELIRKTISQDHPQFSLTGSLGLSYPLYKRLSVYTNIGASYYLDAKNEYETIYSDKKWIFNLNMGFRFGF